MSLAKLLAKGYTKAGEGKLRRPDGKIVSEARAVASASKGSGGAKKSTKKTVPKSESPKAGGGYLGRKSMRVDSDSAPGPITHSDAAKFKSTSLKPGTKSLDDAAEGVARRAETRRTLIAGYDDEIRSINARLNGVSRHIMSNDTRDNLKTRIRVLRRKRKHMIERLEDGI